MPGLRAGDLAAPRGVGRDQPGRAREAAKEGPGRRFGGRRNGELKAVPYPEGKDDGNHPCCPPARPHPGRAGLCDTRAVVDRPDRARPVAAGLPLHRSGPRRRPQATLVSLVAVPTPLLTRRWTRATLVDIRHRIEDQVKSWPVYRQLTGTDRLGRGEAAKSRASGRLAPRTDKADAVV